MTPLSTVLLIIQTALAAAAAVPGADPKILGYIQTALDATTAAITAAKEAEAKVDPGALGPITPIS